MGHTKEKFEELLEGFKTPDLGKAMTWSLTLVQGQTHCFELAREFLKKRSGNFTQTALSFDYDGLVAQYHCSRDDKTYTVKITTPK